jgi:hypothetical protein
VPRLYHFAAANWLGGTDQLLELSQRLTACKGGRTEINQANNARIEHPLRNLQQTLVGTRVKTTLENREPVALGESMNPHRLTVPGMPRIPHRAGIDAMGVTLPSCTIITDRIARWGTGARQSTWMGQRRGRLRCAFPSNDRT